MFVVTTVSVEAGAKLSLAKGGQLNTLRQKIILCIKVKYYFVYSNNNNNISGVVQPYTNMLTLLVLKFSAIQLGKGRNILKALFIKKK